MVVKCVVMAALAAALAGSTAPTRLKPPMISEPFTVLPCPPHPRGTIDFEGCAEHRIVKTDQAINTRVKTIFFLLGHRRGAAAAQARFVRGERAWLTYRRATCLSRADVFYVGASAIPLAFLECESDGNAAHLKDLRSFEHALHH